MRLKYIGGTASAERGGFAGLTEFWNSVNFENSDSDREGFDYKSISKINIVNLKFKIFN